VLRPSHNSDSIRCISRVHLGLGSTLAHVGLLPRNRWVIVFDSKSQIGSTLCHRPRFTPSYPYCPNNKYTGALTARIFRVNASRPWTKHDVLTVERWWLGTDAAGPTTSAGDPHDLAQLVSVSQPSFLSLDSPTSQRSTSILDPNAFESGSSSQPTLGYCLGSPQQPSPP